MTNERSTKEQSCLSGDTVVASTIISTSDINPPMITINVVLNGDTIQSNTGVGIGNLAVVKWTCK